MLYRVFRQRPGASATEPGGPLHVPRDRQGAGRHDRPDRFGAFYAACSPEGAVAEAIQAFRGRSLSDADLEMADGSALALASLDDEAVGPLLDLDDPGVLLERDWRPSEVASRDRRITQSIAARAWDGGALGLSWWSTLDSAWTNVTLFAERTVDTGLVRLASDAERLRVGHPALIAAADQLVIALVRRARHR
jgi:hypothetical protein